MTTMMMMMMIMTLYSAIHEAIEVIEKKSVRSDKTGINKKMSIS